MITKNTQQFPEVGFSNKSKMKYTLHNVTGDYMNVTSSSLKRMKEIADGYNFFVVVVKCYDSPSPWDKNKITEHGSPVYHNDKPRPEGGKWTNLEI